MATFLVRNVHEGKYQVIRLLFDRLYEKNTCGDMDELIIKKSDLCAITDEIEDKFEDVKRAFTLPYEIGLIFQTSDSIFTIREGKLEDVRRKDTGDSDLIELQPFGLRYDGLWNYFYVVFFRTSGTSKLMKLEIKSIGFNVQPIFQTQDGKVIALDFYKKIKSVLYRRRYKNEFYIIDSSFKLTKLIGGAQTQYIPQY